jgi:DNA helicase-2/ATP-dependent DNA helicase PcrA
MLQASARDEDRERLENLKELVSLATEYDEKPPPSGIEELLTHAALESDQDTLRSQREGVALMTVHAAKGLEFPEVFVVGLEEGLFPSFASSSDHSHDEEEERRLLYVAMTRAKKRLWLSWAQSRMLFGSRSLQSPSSFLSEIDERYLAPAPLPQSDEDEPLRVIYLS